MGDYKFKLTKQRKIIMDYLKENYTHPSVDNIYKFVSGELPNISKKTVYMNLRFLVENDLISEIDVKGIFRYEPKLKAHHHSVCKKCGKISDFKSDKLIRYSMKISENIEGFRVENTSTNFGGECAECVGGENGKV